MKLDMNGVADLLGAMVGGLCLVADPADVRKAMLMFARLDSLWDRMMPEMSEKMMVAAVETLEKHKDAWVQDVDRVTVEDAVDRARKDSNKKTS